MRTSASSPPSPRSCSSPFIGSGARAAGPVTEVLIGSVLPLTGNFASLRPAVPLVGADGRGHRQQRLRRPPGAARAGQGLPGARRRADQVHRARRPEPRRAGAHDRRAAHLGEQGPLDQRRGDERHHLAHPAGGGERGPADDVSRRAPRPTLTEKGLKWFFRTGPQRQDDGGQRLLLPQGVAGQGRPQGSEDDRVLHLRQPVLPGQPQGRDAIWRPRPATRSCSTSPSKTGATTLASEVQRLQAAKPDVLFLVQYPAETTVFQNDAKRAGLHARR